MKRRLRVAEPPKEGKVIHITKAKRYPYLYRPLIEPPLKPLGIDACNVSEKGRIGLAGAEIGAEIAGGDLGQTALRKINYVFRELVKFPTPEMRRLGISYMLELVNEYGEPEGLGVLRLAHELYGGDAALSSNICSVAKNIGTERSLSILLDAFISDPSRENHLEALEHFAWWYPGAVSSMLEAIRKSPLHQKEIKKAGYVLSVPSHEQTSI